MIERILRKGEDVEPRATARLETGDEILLAGPSGAIFAAAQTVGPERIPACLDAQGAGRPHHPRHSNLRRRRDDACGPQQRPPAHSAKGRSSPALRRSDGHRLPRRWAHGRPLSRTRPVIIALTLQAGPGSLSGRPGSAWHPKKGTLEPVAPRRDARTSCSSMH